MTYKIINQYGKIIDGKERLEVIKTYLLGLEEAYTEHGTANIVEVVVYDQQTTINVEVTIFNRDFLGERGCECTLSKHS